MQRLSRSFNASRGSVDPQAIREYLSLGFIPEADLASRYLQRLLTGPAGRGADPTELLVEIVGDLTAGASDVVIPLSGGRDSRALLGAALQCFSNRNIHCFTFGPDGSADVEGARVACASARVSHRVMDPDTFDWDLEGLTDEMHARLAARTGVPPIDGMLVFGKLADAMPADLPVLSGFLGDATIGRHLDGEVIGEADSQALALFYSQNRAVLQEQPDAMFRDFLKSHGRLCSIWPGLSKMDLLDLGFAQRSRFRPSVSGSFQNAVRPYEDPRWVGHWFSRPLSERMDCGHYDALLARSFPLIFGRLPLASRVRRWRARRRGRGGYRGDPRRNPSMAAALGEACRSFDERRIIGESATSAFKEWLQQPSLAPFRKVRWFATAEIVARAQERISF